jgi:hypothetical protein
LILLRFFCDCPIPRQAADAISAPVAELKKEAPRQPNHHAVTVLPEGFRAPGPHLAALQGSICPGGGLEPSNSDPQACLDSGLV